MVAEISERHRACPAYRLNLKLSQGLYGICKYLESIDLNANVLLVNSRDDAVWPKQKGVPCQCAWLAFPCKYMENSSPGFLSWSFSLISWLFFSSKFLWSKCTIPASHLLVIYFPLSIYHWKPPLWSLWCKHMHKAKKFWGENIPGRTMLMRDGCSEMLMHETLMLQDLASALCLANCDVLTQGSCRQKVKLLISLKVMGIGMLQIKGWHQAAFLAQSTCQ